MPKTASIPKYLKNYIVEQDYEHYTSLEHATWRYIMRQSRSFFGSHAVPTYVDGLKKTGIPIDRIPRISEMNKCLAEYGWGAAGVCGFVPSSVFLDLLAHGILPIATGMRTAGHVAYTPAPDIVHEAAGHAPILADPDYRNFLKSYAEVAYRAIISKEDIGLYEAIRYLSDIKENPDATKTEIDRAEEKLQAAYSSLSYVSEAGKVARLAWWTIEYGLVGNKRQPKIYGAGLLSSVGESQACLTDKIKKIPLSVACTEQSYDITRHQPQLFVAESLESLPAVLDELASTFVYKCGGKKGLEEAKRAETINTIVLDSGISISGILTQFEWQDARADFIKFAGPVQLACDEKEISGQGREHHPSGFSSPIGRFTGLAQTSPAKVSDKDLEKIGVKKGERTCLKFQSGFEVDGLVSNIVRHNGNLVLISWRNVQVRRGSDVFYKPEWGDFDMVVGEKIASVFCGPADRGAFGDYDVGTASTSPERTSKYSDREVSSFEIFTKLRQMRLGQKNNSNKEISKDLEALSEALCQSHADQWLAGLEVVEIAGQKLGLGLKDTDWLKKINREIFAKVGAKDRDIAELINRGLEIHTVLD